MKFGRIFVIGLAIICLFIGTTACEKEGTAEKTGKEIDRALDSAKQKLDDATK